MFYDGNKSLWGKEDFSTMKEQQYSTATIYLNDNGGVLEIK